MIDIDLSEGPDRGGYWHAFAIDSDLSCTNDPREFASAYSCHSMTDVLGKMVLFLYKNDHKMELKLRILKPSSLKDWEARVAQEKAAKNERI